MAALQHFVGGADDGVGLVLRELAEGAVDGGGGALHLRQRGDQFGGHLLGRDVEMVQGTLGLRAPQLTGGYVDRAETVLLNPVFHRNFLFS